MGLRNPPDHRTIRECLVQLASADPFKIVGPRTPVLGRSRNIGKGKYQQVECGVESPHHSDIKRFMLDNFYPAAPVPKCLGLYDGENVSRSLDQEISMFSSSGVSFGLLHRGEVMGAGWNLYISSRVDPVNSKHFGYIPAKDWHNTAADISEELQDPKESVQTWRKYQFLHLFHFGSHVIRVTGAKFVVHLSQLALSEEYRSGKDNIIKDCIENAVEEVNARGGVCTTVSNFPSFDAHLLKEFPALSLVDSVEYEDLKLKINNRKVFQPLFRLQRINYYAFTNI